MLSPPDTTKAQATRVLSQFGVTIANYYTNKEA